MLPLLSASSPAAAVRPPRGPADGTTAPRPGTTPFHHPASPGALAAVKRRENTHDARFLTFSTYRRLPLFQNPAVKDAFAFHLKHVAESVPFQLAVG